MASAPDQGVRHWPWPAPAPNQRSDKNPPSRPRSGSPTISVSSTSGQQCPNPDLTARDSHSSRRQCPSVASNPPSPNDPSKIQRTTITIVQGLPVEQSSSIAMNTGSMVDASNTHLLRSTTGRNLSRRRPADLGSGPPITSSKPMIRA
ncbi:hypothetical protein ACLOJK_041495 [Asimina triloba]